MSVRQKRVCLVEMASSLDSRFRKWFQDPWKILLPYVKKGMTVMDLGCGPGYFSLAMAQMVGRSGRVVTCDLQEGMLQKLANKMQGTNLEERIILHKCATTKIGWPEQIDFVLAFYVMHEIPDQRAIFGELASILPSAGQILVVEPPFHVSKSNFQKTKGNFNHADP